MIPEQQHSDRVWSRAHDAVLAEKCEVLKVRWIAVEGGTVPSILNGPSDLMGCLPHYDDDPAAARSSRLALMDQAVEAGWIVAGAHLPGPGIGQIMRDGTGYRFHPVGRI